MSYRPVADEYFQTPFVYYYEMDYEWIESALQIPGRNIIRRGHMAETEQRGRSGELIAEMMSHHAQIFHFCLGFCRNAADAEDLTHDVYLKALEKMAFLRDRGKLKIWLFRIARNICLNHARRARFLRLFRQMHPQPHSDEGDPEIDLRRKERIRRLKETLSRLPRRQREALTLREYGGLSYQEIAATMRISEGTVMSTLSSARKKVVQSMQGRERDDTRTS